MKKRILIVDDAMSTMASMVDQLSDEGFLVQSVANLPDAVEVLRNREFDAVIVDCVMATGHEFLEAQRAGVQLIERIRSGSPSVAGCNQKIPVLVLTAVCDRETLSDLNKADVQGVFQKPVATRELLDSLNTLLEKSEKRGN